MPRPSVRLLTTAALTVAALGVVVGPSAAHVTVPDPATQGGFGAITFRVPTERPNASTNKLEVTFPADQPLAFVSVKPRPGWTYKVDKAKLAQPLDVEGRQVTEAVSKITWTAATGPVAIHPGEYDEFSVSVGFLPKAEHMVFKAVQTYDNGEIVRWIEQAAPGAAEPEHPAPVLTLVPEQEQQTVGLTTQQSSEDAPSRSAVNLAIGLSIAALLVGLVAGAVGAAAFRRRA
jgi:uncharacterized protein YcnI